MYPARIYEEKNKHEAIFPYEPDESVAISDFVIDFALILEKRRVFAHVELMHRVLDDIVDHIGQDVMDRGDMFVRSVKVWEGLSSGTNRTFAECSQEMMLYGDGENKLQIDETNRKRGICCSQCMKTFSLQRSLLRMQEDHLHFI